MSDTGRQSLSDKATAAMKPDSEKSTSEHLGDKFKGTSDSMASSMQPQSEKSTTQKMGDSVSSGYNILVDSSTNESLVDKAKNAMGMGNKD